MIEATPHDYGRMAELLAIYQSLRLQVVDACVVALAERLDVREIAALDRRDLTVVAPRHLPKGERLTLLPADQHGPMWKPPLPVKCAVVPEGSPGCSKKRRDGGI